MRRTSLRAILCVAALVASGTARAQVPATAILDGGGADPREPLVGPHGRFGITATAGMTASFGSARGVVGGEGAVSVRFGVQLGRVFALYLNETATLGTAARAPRTVAAPVLASALWSTAMAGFILRDRLEIAVGPSFDAISAAGAVAGATGTSAGEPYTGYGPGMHARLACRLSRRVDDRGFRRGATLSVELHQAFFLGLPLSTLGLGIGGDWY